MKRYTIVQWIHNYLRNNIKQGDFCIDATAGKGNDTAFLCELVGERGKVLAFDIQQLAIEETKKTLQKKNLDKIAEVVLDSHANMKNYVEENTVNVILFNLGYLPGGDHSIATKSESTIEAISSGLSLLKSDGIMSICIYSGGDSGFEEKENVLDYLKTLDCKKYSVIINEFYNKPNNPPLPIFIIKN